MHGHAWSMHGPCNSMLKSDMAMHGIAWDLSTGMNQTKIMLRKLIETYFLFLNLFEKMHFLQRSFPYMHSLQNAFLAFFCKTSYLASILQGKNSLKDSFKEKKFFERFL